MSPTSSSYLEQKSGGLSFIPGLTPVKTVAVMMAEIGDGDGTNPPPPRSMEERVTALQKEVKIRVKAASMKEHSKDRIIDFM